MVRMLYGILDPLTILPLIIIILTDFVAIWFRLFKLHLFVCRYYQQTEALAFFSSLLILVSGIIIFELSCGKLSAYLNLGQMVLLFLVTLLIILSEEIVDDNTIRLL